MLEFAKPFPLTSEAIDALPCSDIKSRYSEYFSNVYYHQQLAAYASRSCDQNMHDYAFLVLDSGKQIQFTKLPNITMVMHGDIAIREISSAIDSALQLTNFVASLDITPKKVKWSLRCDCEMRNKLLEIGEKAARLVASIDDVYNSIGYMLMNHYRNWVTHRGAPRLVRDPLLEKPIVLPVNIAYSLGPSLIQQDIHSYTRRIIYDNLKVVCHRFRAPVENVYTKTFTPDDEKIILGGQVIGTNAGKIEMVNVRFSIGNMLDKAHEYQARNPNWLGEKNAEIAGEKLTVYDLTDYRQALNHASDFYYYAVTGMWDRELALWAKQLTF